MVNTAGRRGRRRGPAAPARGPDGSALPGPLPGPGPAGERATAAVIPSRPGRPGPRPAAQAAVRTLFALVAYMSTYSWPESRITSVITSSVIARST